MSAATVKVGIDFQQFFYGAHLEKRVFLYTFVAEISVIQLLIYGYDKQ